MSEVGSKGGVDKCMQTAVQLQCDREHCLASASVRAARSVVAHSSQNHGGEHKTLTLIGIQCVYADRELLYVSGSASRCLDVQASRCFLTGHRPGFRNLFPCKGKYTANS